MSLLKFAFAALVFATTSAYANPKPSTDPIQDEITMGKIAAAEQALLNEQVIAESLQLLKEASQMREALLATSASSNWKISALDQMMALIVEGLEQMETPEDVAAVQALNMSLMDLMKI